MGGSGGVYRFMSLSFGVANLAILCDQFCRCSAGGFTVFEGLGYPTLNQIWLDTSRIQNPGRSGPKLLAAAHEGKPVSLATEVASHHSKNPEF
jgi:hypothetical protein